MPNEEEILNLYNKQYKYKLCDSLGEEIVRRKWCNQITLKIETLIIF